ncbi:MAG: hypothetical protein KBS79_03170 [Lachnospiraceae bacterium]|nr:hypothetical protein [Candidatus Minthocola equi]
MDFITKNIKKARVFNTILLAAAAVLCILQFIQFAGNLSGSDNDITTIFSAVFFQLYDIVYILAIVFGFLYMFGYYKKDAAKFYRRFMFLFSLSEFLLVVADLIGTKAMGAGSNISGVLATAVCVNTFLLTFAKDLGRKTSIGLAISLLAVMLINSIRLLILYSSILSFVALAVMDIAIACIACLFVLAKYADKAERGTK